MVIFHRKLLKKAPPYLHAPREQSRAVPRAWYRRWGRSRSCPAKRQAQRFTMGEMSKNCLGLKKVAWNVVKKKTMFVETTCETSVEFVFMWMFGENQVETSWSHIFPIVFPCRFVRIKRVVEVSCWFPLHLIHSDSGNIIPGKNMGSYHTIYGSSIGYQLKCLWKYWFVWNVGKTPKSYLTMMPIEIGPHVG